MAFGLANKEIAQRLSLSTRTVETHIDHVLGKLNAPTRARAVVEAGRAGLLGGAITSAAAHSPDSRPNNLPFQLTTLLGREQDLVDTKSLLEAHRLVTLSGSGGVGKTRLALRIGVDLLDIYHDGVWLCDFSPLSGPAFVASVVAKVLAVQEQPNRSLVESIVESLRRKQALLILDNCEHVLDACAELVDEILHSCPNIRILATSREALGIVGEVVDRVRSLSLPDSAEGLSADESLRYGAIALFVDRAQASDIRFSFTTENVQIVAEICGRLDGIPLAIELAATRSKVLNLHTLYRSLDDRFTVLTGGSRTALPRHKTLTALIDWSYDLLSAQERTLFNRVGIFAGGFSLAAATAVCGGDGLDANQIVSLLVSLTEKSLVVANTAGDNERYGLLESTRGYAFDKLSALGERERLARRHAEYFRDRAQAADDRSGASWTFAWLDREELELDNYRAALMWGLHERGDAVVGATIAGGLSQLWYRGGLEAEGRYWIEPALERIDANENPQLAARLWRALADLSSTKRGFEAARNAVTLYEAAGDDLGGALALNCLAKRLRHVGRLGEAHESSVRALATLRACGDRGGTAQSLNQQGLIAAMRGETVEARDLYAQALALYRSVGDELGIAGELLNLAELEFIDGHPEQALRSGIEALAICSGRRTHSISIAIGNNNNALYQIAIGDIDGARASASEGVRIARKIHDALIIAAALENFALILALTGHRHRAAGIQGYVEARFRELGYAREPADRWFCEKLMAALRAQLSEAEIVGLEAEGAAWTEDQAVEEAMMV
jgi:predicted ATPase